MPDLLQAVDLPDEYEEDDVEYDPVNDTTAICDSEDDETCNTIANAHELDSAPTNMVETADPYHDPILSEEDEMELDRPDTNSSNDQVAKQLRSRVNLKEVTIEELDLNFQPPDVTPDMYTGDVHNDDYAQFCAETYNLSLADVIAERDDDESEDDPDFVCDEFDLQEVKRDDGNDEYLFNRNTKISAEESGDLLHELVNVYDLNDHKSKPPSQKRKECEKQQTFEASDADTVSNSPRQESQAPVWYGLTPEQTQLIGQQVRQHIQLTTQMALLTSKRPEIWGDSHKQCRQMLSELMSHSHRNSYSVLAQGNLFSSMQLLDDWDKTPSMPSEAYEKKGKLNDISLELMAFMGESSAFVYPSLLPASALIRNFQTSEKSKLISHRGVDL